MVLRWALHQYLVRLAIGGVALSLQLAAEAVRRWRELIGMRTNAEH